MWRATATYLPWRALAPVLLLILCASLFPHMEVLFRWLQPDSAQVIYDRDSFWRLLLSHAGLVLLSGAIATVVGVVSGILVTRESGRDFLPLVNNVASIGQTFPPVAVLALAVPMTGFGGAPTVVALTLYGLLPVVRNTIAGLEGVSGAVLEAARGMGMSPSQVLWKVELPLAFKVIMAGVRTSVTINIATAAIGSTIGAKTLGDPIVAGLINGNTAYVLQGAILVALLAVAADAIFERIENASA
ncbi:ABC-type proline/glycine betaine transport system, permease component [Hahella chejuensis KCTC 2396]|uniref:ABC-type proline/glycine betaine transport system, permease component n=1 Tax=Hahella chejuensis (strain KCTC 2396) TaxID=349521 RepID=Q2SQJ6_HAHCH|nr:ABC transporter permease [Hahella chejuensis]ABC27078.1 ABC-type proline/glycine betaine transport system, permease component [Hahella chejuensis KCTC 2396]